MVPVTEFLPTLRMLVDVPVPGLMEVAIIKAAQRFCRDSKVLVKSRRFMDVYQCQTVSIVGANSDVKGAGIVNVVAKGVALVSGTDYSIVGRNDVRFHFDFSDVFITGIVEPVHNAMRLDDILFDDYLDGICAGAASILQMQPTTTWFNPDLAIVNEREFVSTIRHAYRYTIDRTPALEEPRPITKREFY